MESPMYQQRSQRRSQRRSQSRTRSQRRSQRRSQSRTRSQRRSQRRSQTRSQRRSQSRTRSQKGGGGAADWMLQTVGNMNDQFNRTFLGDGPATNLQPIIPIKNTLDYPRTLQSGGKRRSRTMRRSRSQSKTGGYIGEVLSAAAVPLALFGIQRKLAKRHKNKHSKHHKFRK